MAKFVFEDLEVKTKVGNSRPGLVLKAGSGALRQAVFVDEESAALVAEIFEDTRERLAGGQAD